MLSTAIFGLLLHSVCVLGQDQAKPTPTRLSILKYDPSVPAAVIAGLLYALIFFATIVWFFKRRARYMLAITVGSFFYALGLFLRIIVAKSTGITLYAIMNSFTVLAPCGFIATVYMLLGRLAIHLRADDFLLVKSGIITRVFVTSDVVTLLIQASGGGMSAIQSVRNIGNKLFLVGLIVQLVSFALYVAVFAVFLYRMKTQRPSECHLPRNKSEFFSHWTTLAGAMIISCIGILIRTFFRTFEYSDGYDGHLAAVEIYFYVLDTLPLFIAVVVYLITWPPLYLTGLERNGSMDTTTGVEMGMAGQK